MPLGIGGPQPGGGGDPQLASYWSASCATSAGCSPIIFFIFNSSFFIAPLGAQQPAAADCNGNGCWQNRSRSDRQPAAAPGRRAAPLRRNPSARLRAGLATGIDLGRGRSGHSYPRRRPAAPCRRADLSQAAPALFTAPAPPPPTAPPPVGTPPTGRHSSPGRTLRCRRAAARRAP